MTDIDLYPIAIIEDRYGGSYSGGRWLAIAGADEVDGGPPYERRVAECLDGGPHGGDGEAMTFWISPPKWIAVGDTPDAALAALRQKYGVTP